MVKKKNLCKFKIEKRYLYKFFKHADCMVDEIKLDFEDGKMVSKSVDSAHVGMADVTLHEDAFKTYSEREKSVGIRTDTVLNFLQNFNYDDIITLEFYNDTDYSGSPFVNLTASKELYTLTDTKKTLDTAGMTDPTAVPDLDLKTEVEIPNEALRDISQHISTLTDYLTFEYSDEELEMYAEEDKNKSSMKIHEMKILEDKSNGDDLQSLLALDYFKGITNTIKKKADVKIGIGDDLPVEFKAEFEDGLGEVRYLQAPRLETR